jgi:hypothetical protein
MLILRHVDPHESPRFFNLYEGPITGGLVFTLVAIKVIRDLLREFCFPYARATKEEHDEGTVGIDPPILAQTYGRRDRPNRTPLPNYLVSDDFLDLFCEIGKEKRLCKHS